MESSAAAAPFHGTVRSESADHTHAIGRALGERAQPGTVVALVGELGAGKTRLTKGIAEGLGITGVVNSPTFVLMNEHHGRLPLYHVDAYRLGDPEEGVAAGLLDEGHTDGVAVIEWADRLDAYLPEERLEIVIEIPDADATTRDLHWRAHGRQHVRLASEALGS